MVKPTHLDNAVEDLIDRAALPEAPPGPLVERIDLARNLSTVRLDIHCCNPMVARLLHDHLADETARNVVLGAIGMAAALAREPGK